MSIICVSANVCGISVNGTDYFELLIFWSIIPFHQVLLSVNSSAWMLVNIWPRKLCFLSRNFETFRITSSIWHSTVCDLFLWFILFGRILLSFYILYKFDVSHFPAISPNLIVGQTRFIIPYILHVVEIYRFTLGVSDVSNDYKIRLPW